MTVKTKKKGDKKRAEYGISKAQEMEAMRAGLLRKRNEILKEAKEQISNSISGDLRQLVETALDEGDFAEINVQEDLNLKRLSKYRDYLHDIDETLRKIKEGTYGICENCGEKISENRLKVMPASRFCIYCQEIKEQMERAEGKPVEMTF